jgi:hypothetical protein
MSKPNTHDYPANAPQSIYRLIAQANRHENAQATAASLAASFLWVATFDGQMGDAFIQLSAVVASGESMTYAILKNGTTIMVGGTALTVDSTNGTAKAQIPLLSSLTETGRSFVVGDVFTVTRVYTAGGGATPMAYNVVVIEPSLSAI